ncbi:hypothetical protein OROHE_008555 [Orobanche hederae]
MLKLKFTMFLSERDKNLLMECMASRLKHKKRARDYGGRLASSSGRILLQCIPGAELYREKLVKALAKDLHVPLMMLDSSVLSSYVSLISDQISFPSQICMNMLMSTEQGNFQDYGQDESDEESKESDEESSACWSSDDEDSSSDEEYSDDSDDEDEGDRVIYMGPSDSIKVNNRTLSSGERGEVHEVNGDKVAVVFYVSPLGTNETEKDEKSPDPLIPWLDVEHIIHDKDAQTHDCHVMESQQPVIVYFPNSFWWLSRTVSKKIRKEFFDKVKEMFDQLSGRVVLICGQNKWEDGSKEVKKTLKKVIKGLQATKRYEENEMLKLFPNLLCIRTPKKEDLLKTFCKQMEQDWETVRLRTNSSEMHKVLKEHDLLCMDLERVNTDGLVLNKRKAEKIIGWATNHYLSSCQLPSIKEERMNVPQASLELAITRLKEQETESKKKSSKDPKDLAKGYYERSFISAVISPREIGVKFDDVGALEDVKAALNELVLLPMKKPDLFSRGNLLRPCKGMLLFGPPGTGKTLIAKALATEAGANFINVAPSNLTSKWHGDEEQLVKALFSYASKLAPVIIFVDEVDALLGARNSCEHEATRRMRNEFMAAWDGLTSKESQRILILGATNRPFDLDDAIIRRMPRRVYVDLPDAKNRSKILKILLAQETLESGFSLEQLAAATEGYSGSDLKNLCVAAAYKPVQEILKEESKIDTIDGAQALRPLKLDDFIRSKAKVGASVAYNTTSLIQLRKWNEQYGEGGSRSKTPFGF